MIRDIWLQVSIFRRSHRSSTSLMNSQATSLGAAPAPRSSNFWDGILYFYNPNFFLTYLCYMNGLHKHFLLDRVPQLDIFPQIHKCREIWLINTIAARQYRSVRRPRHLERLPGHAQGPQEVRPALQVVTAFEEGSIRPGKGHVFQRVCQYQDRPFQKLWDYIVLALLAMLDEVVSNVTCFLNPWGDNTYPII